MNENQESAEEPLDPMEAPLGAGIDFSDPNSPLAPYYLQASHVVAAVLIGLAAFLLCNMPLFYTDVWGHLAYGREIIDQGALPDRETLNPFSDSEGIFGHFQALSQLLFLGFFRLGESLAGGEGVRGLEGGVLGLRTLTLIVGVSYAWFLLLAFRRAAGTMAVACAGLALLFCLSWTTTILRPQILGQLCFAILVWLLSNPQPTRRLLIILPVLFTIWANLHGSFVIGFYFAGLVFAGKAVQSMRLAEGSSAGAWDWRGAMRAQGNRLLFVALGISTVAALLLNPHGPALLPRVLALGSHPNIRWFDEWQPMGLDLTSFIFWRYFATLLLIAVSWQLGRSAITWSHIFVLLGFVFLPWLQVRMLVWWFPLSVWLLMPAWGLVKIPDGKLSFIKTIMVGLIVVALLPFTPPVRWLLAGRPSSLKSATDRHTPWPVVLQLENADLKAPALPGLAKGLAEHYPGGRFQGAIFATETLGDFFLWRIPEMPVFMYSHVHLFTPEHWREVLRVRFAEPGWRDVLDKNSINLVVAEAANHGKLLSQLKADADWQVVYDGRDPAFPVFVVLRKTPLPLPAQVVARMKKE